MKNTTETGFYLTSSDILHHIGDHKVQGALYLENHYYPVFLSRQNETALELSKSVVEVGHFELDGQTYAICMSRVSRTKENVELNNILTKRETEITSLVALGLPNKQIAAQLNISEWTVSSHLRRIFAKLEVSSRAAMVYRYSVLTAQVQFNP